MDCGGRAIASTPLSSATTVYEPPPIARLQIKVHNSPLATRHILPGLIRSDLV